MSKKIFIIIPIILIIGFAFYFLTLEKTNPNEVTLYGNIEIRQVDLGFQVSGKISEMFKEEGDMVKKGELIALLNDKDYSANLAEAEADVARTKSLANDAASKYERQSPLCLDNTVSKMECDTLLNTKNKTFADYKAALAQLSLAKNQLGYTKLYAPDEGTVMIRVQEPGAAVNKNQIVYTISKTKPVWIRAYIKETELGNIKYGMGVKVYIDSIDPKTSQKRNYDGRIGYISPVAEFTPKTVQTTDLRTDLVYRIRIYIDNIDEYLRQGMPATVVVTKE